MTEKCLSQNLVPRPKLNNQKKRNKSKKPKNTIHNRL